MATNLFQQFFRANSRLSARFDRRGDTAIYARYDDIVADAIASLPEAATVADLGGGRTCSFADRLIAGRDLRLVSVDVSAEELAANTTAHETRVGDVSKHIPFTDAEVDLLVSRTLLEHVLDVEAAVDEMARVLKPGARTVHLLPCRYALFAIVARIVPFKLAKRVLHTMIPESRGIVEFDVHYDRGHPSALEQLFRSAGFREVAIECTWDQSAYFHAIFPVFLLVLGYQRLAEALGVRVLASYALVHAVR